MAGESTGQTEARLRKEGRWAAYRKLAKKYQRQGFTTGDAYREAKEHFQPLEQHTPPPPPSTDVAADTQLVDASGRVPLRECILWVFQHAEDPNVNSRNDAPDAGAWGLLHWVRKHDANKTVFYSNMVKALLPTRAQLDRADEFDDSDRDIDDEITRQLRDLRDASLRSGPEGLEVESVVPA